MRGRGALVWKAAGKKGGAVTLLFSSQNIEGTDKEVMNPAIYVSSVHVRLLHHAKRKGWSRLCSPL